MRTAVPFVACLGVLALAAAPGPEAVRLEWNVHSACPSRESFWQALLARSTRVRRASTGEPARTAQVDIKESGSGSLGRVSIDGAEPRTIQGATCTEVVEAVAIVTALVLDPTASVAASASSSASPVTPPPNELGTSMLVVPAEAVSSTPRIETPPPPPPTPSRDSWALGALGGAFTTSGVGLVPTVGIALDYTRGVAVRLVASRATSEVVRNVNGPGAHFTWWTARANLCGARGPRFFALQPCIGLEAGTIGGDSVDVDRPAANQRFWLAAHLLSRVSLTLGRGIELEAEGGTALNFTRPTFFVDPGYFIYQPAAFLFRATLGLTVRFS